MQWNEILNQANSENFSCLSHVEPRNLPRCPKSGAIWSGPFDLSLDIGDNPIIFAQFYIQLLYRPHFGTWILPFGLLGSTVGSKWKISEMTEFLLKYATFWGGFFNFLRAKKNLRFFCPQKVDKTTSKSCILKQNFRRFRNFSLTVQLFWPCQWNLIKKFQTEANTPLIT